jgi:hypothetical protein
MRYALISLLLIGGVAAADVAKIPAESKPQPQPQAGAPATHTAPRDPGPRDMEQADIVAMPRRVPAKPPLPATAPEIAKLGKQIAGAYKCKGVSLRGDGSSQPLQATITTKLDLDNAWIQSSLVEDGKPTGAGIKFVEYTTFDPTAKQWTRIQMASSMGHVISTSLGETDGKWTWEGTATSPSGTMQVRNFEQRDSKQTKVWGEALLSGSWQKLYEATCKK